MKSKIGNLKQSKEINNCLHNIIIKHVQRKKANRIQNNQPRNRNYKIITNMKVNKDWNKVWIDKQVANKWI